MSDLMHVSLFAGVGGGDLGMAAAGIPTVAAVEIDTQARGVLAHRFPDAVLFSDVREVTGDDLRAAGAVPERTILSGGFPCQPFSVAGRRQGVDDEAGRGNLFWEIDRILAEFPARWIVLENVPGLLSIDSGRTMGTILWDLGQRGYGLCYRILDAQYFGVPQRRRRVFIVGRAGDDRGPVQVLLEPEGGAGDIAPRGAAGPGTARGAEGGADGAGVFQCHGSDVGELGTVRAGNGGVTGGVPFVFGQHKFAGYGPGVKTLQATDHKRAEDNLVVSALQTVGPGGGHRIDVESAAGGHLVPWVKTIRSGARDENGDLPPEVWEAQDVSPTLNVFDNNSEARATVLAVLDTQNATADDGDVSHTLQKGNGSNRGYPVIAVTGTIAHTLRAEGADASEDGTGRGTPIVSISNDSTPVVGNDMVGAGEVGTGLGIPSAPAVVAPTLSASNDPSRSPQSAEVTAQVDAVHAAASVVRRLTPTECERLMGWPSYLHYGDDMTNDEYVAALLASGAVSVDPDAGIVYRHRGGGGRPIDPVPVGGSDTNGYRAATFRLAGDKRQIRLHRVVWIAANGVPPEGMAVCHRDNVKTNNRLPNLYLATPEENCRDAHRDGLIPPRQKLTPEQRTELVREFNAGARMRDLLQKYGIQKARAYQIVRESGHTAERIDFRTGRVVAQADSSRYRQCGNGMAAPVVAWIARRILAVEAATEDT